MGTRGCHQLGTSEKPHRMHLSQVSAQDMQKGEVCPPAASPIPMVKGGLHTSRVVHESDGREAQSRKGRHGGSQEEALTGPTCMQLVEKVS